MATLPVRESLGAMMRRAETVENVTKYLDEVEHKYRGRDHEMSGRAVQNKAKLRLLQTDFDGGSQVV